VLAFEWLLVTTRKCPETPQPSIIATVHKDRQRRYIVAGVLLSHKSREASLRSPLGYYMAGRAGKSRHLFTDEKAPHFLALRGRDPFAVPGDVLGENLLVPIRDGWRRLFVFCFG
jgi:hypothetical protein